MKEHFAHDDTQNRIAEELELFVVVDVGGRLVGIGSVRKSEVQKLNAPEPHARLFLEQSQFFFSVFRNGYCRRQVRLKSLT
jgi:hypothetical protein